MEIGTKIKNARLKHRMTQEELGARVGVKKSAIAKYENGRVVNIKRSTLLKISNVLDIPPVELVFEEDALGKPADDAELSKNVKQLVDFAMCVPDDKAELILRVMKSIVEDE